MGGYWGAALGTGSGARQVSNRGLLDWACGATGGLLWEPARAPARLAIAAGSLTGADVGCLDSSCGYTNTVFVPTNVDNVIYNVHIYIYIPLSTPLVACHAGLDPHIKGLDSSGSTGTNGHLQSPRRNSAKASAILCHSPSQPAGASPACEPSEPASPARAAPTNGTGAPAGPSTAGAAGAGCTQSLEPTAGGKCVWFIINIIKQNSCGYTNTVFVSTNVDNVI